MICETLVDIMCNTVAHVQLQKRQAAHLFNDDRSLSPPSLVGDQPPLVSTEQMAFVPKDLSSLINGASSMVTTSGDNLEITDVAAEANKDHVTVSMLQLVVMLNEWTTHHLYPPFPVLDIQVCDDHDEVILSAFAQALEAYTVRCPGRIQFLGLTLNPELTLGQAKILCLAIRRCHKLRAVRLDFAGAHHRYALLLVAAAIGNSSVRSLILDGNGITDATVRWIAGILQRKSQDGKHTISLKHLSLCHNPISPAALASSSIWKQIKVKLRCQAQFASKETL